MYAVHGRWEIKVTNNVLMQRFSDSWNEEAVLAFVKEFKVAAEPLVGKQWAIISVFNDWQLAVPEVGRHVMELSAWFIAHGCTHDCHIYTPNALKSSQLERNIPVTKGSYQRQVFSDSAQALNWLNDEGFTIVDDGFLDK